MRISDLFKQKKNVYSFEIFPPKVESNISGIYDTLDGLSQLKPDYISVTYSAGGGSNNARSIELASLVKNKYGIEPLAHLTCINSTKEKVLETIQTMKNEGIENILALRGDKNPNSICTDFKYASDLVEFINQYGDFDIAGACYPETHPEAVSADVDIDNLKRKVDMGMTHLNTQLFYDNEDFYRFMDKIRAKGINVPVQAGIMPLVKKGSIERTISMAATKIPAKLSRMIARFIDDPVALQEAGILYATDQIADLLSAQAAQGIHLYVMNNSYVANKITKNIQSLVEGVNK